MWIIKNNNLYINNDSFENLIDVLTLNVNLKQSHDKKNCAVYNDSHCDFYQLNEKKCMFSLKRYLNASKHFPIEFFEYHNKTLFAFNTKYGFIDFRNMKNEIIREYKINAHIISYHNILNKYLIVKCWKNGNLEYVYLFDIHELLQDPSYEASIIWFEDETEFTINGTIIEYSINNKQHSNLFDFCVHKEHTTKEKIKIIQKYRSNIEYMKQKLEFNTSSLKKLLINVLDNFDKQTCEFNNYQICFPNDDNLKKQLEHVKNFTITNRFELYGNIGTTNDHAILSHLPLNEFNTIIKQISNKNENKLYLFVSNENDENIEIKLDNNKIFVKLNNE